MFYIGLILFILGAFSLFSTIVTLKKYKKQYGKDLEDFLNVNR